MRLSQDETYAIKDYRTALKKAFLGTDDDLRTGMLRIPTSWLYLSWCGLDPAFYHDPSGCTAVAALLTSDGQIFCVRPYSSTPPRPALLIMAINQANAGDSRAVMSVKGEAKPLSYDHKPQNKGEVDPVGLPMIFAS